MTRRFAALVLLLCCAFGGPARGAAIPQEIKKVVTFVFLSPDGGRTFTPDGTGFFVGVKVRTGDFQVFLVTARHVLKNPRGKYYHRIWIRLNTRDGGSKMIPLSLTGAGAVHVYEHPTEPSVDLAVIPALPDKSLYDFEFIPDEMLTTKESFSELHISEGTDVFFSGLFLPFIGQARNYPITRFGKVAMMPDEKIPWQDGEGKPLEMADLYLLETQAFAGSSGSPVFFYLGSNRSPGVLPPGSPIIKLAGVMMGAFKYASPLMTADKANQDVGIAVVVPSYHLHEILFSDPVKSLLK